MEGGVKERRGEQGIVMIPVETVGGTGFVGGSVLLLWQDGQRTGHLQSQFSGLVAGHKVTSARCLQPCVFSGAQ